MGGTAIPLYSLKKTQWSSFSSDFSGKNITCSLFAEAHKQHSSDPKLLACWKQTPRVYLHYLSSQIIRMRKKRKEREYTGTQCLTFLLRVSDKYPEKWEEKSQAEKFAQFGEQVLAAPQKKLLLKNKSISLPKVRRGGQLWTLLLNSFTALSMSKQRHSNCLDLK